MSTDTDTDPTAPTIRERATSATPATAITPLVGDEHRSQAIVVGVDGSPASRAAVDFAVAEAQHRHATLELMHAFDIPIYATDPMGTAYIAIDRDELAAAATTVLAEELARVGRLAPELPVRTVLHQGSAGQMLVDVSGDRAMVVVGAKHRSEFVDMMLGSVCHKVLHHAHCPVVLVPPPASVDAPR